MVVQELCVLSSPVTQHLSTPIWNSAPWDSCKSSRNINFFVGETICGVSNQMCQIGQKTPQVSFFNWNSHPARQWDLLTNSVIPRLKFCLNSLSRTDHEPELIGSSLGTQFRWKVWSWTGLDWAYKSQRFGILILNEQIKCLFAKMLWICLVYPPNSQ